VGVLALAAPFACAPQFDTTRDPPARGTVGQELFGVVCDRVGAQSLTEDMSGASFHYVCHPYPDGTYATAVDQTQLPPPQATTTAAGQPVTLAEATATRAHAVARVAALAKDRAALIAAFDATLPASQIPVKNLGAGDPSASCGGDGTDKLPNQLADLLERFGPLYKDGTVPQSTEALARVFDAFQADGDARAAYARFDARAGYRPLAVTLGALRPILAYPGLRDFANSTLSLISDDTNPAAGGAPTPGAAYPELVGLLDTSYQELRTATGDGYVAPLTISGTDPVGRAVLSRPRTDLEFMQQLFYAEDPAFGLPGSTSRYIARRDPRGYAAVALDASGKIPFPFVDQGGLPQIDSLGQFVTSSGQPVPSPFLAPDGVVAPAYDGYGRALPRAGGPLFYDYIDTSHTYAASLMNDMQSLVVPDQTGARETIMNALAGAFVVAGPRSAATKQYAPDPTASASWAAAHPGQTPPGGLDQTPVTLAYSGFSAESSAMLDLTYGIMQTMPGPANDDLLAYLTLLLGKDTNEVARLIGTGLAMKANADAATGAHIPATSTFWDEMIDVAIQIEQEPGLLEDVLTSLGDNRTPGLAKAFSNYNKYRDQISYDRNNLNGPAFNMTTGTASPMQTPVDRSRADTGYNRSAFQRFLQIIHDTDNVTVCNKNGASVDAEVTVLGANISVTMPNDDPCDQWGPILGSGTYPECAVFKIENAAAFYLDSIIGRASLYLRDPELRTGIGTNPGATLCPSLGLEAATVGLMTQSSGLVGSVGSWSAFWDPADSQSLRPTPQFLDRQMFFDLANDSPNGSGPNAQTNQFLFDLDGPNIGTAVCDERVITDPAPGAADASPDGLVHGLRSCPEGDWLYQRDNNTIFVWEDFDFYSSITPLVTAFANHGREDLFIALMEVMDRHWADGKGTADECLLSRDPSAPYPTCSKDGLVTYEPLMVEQYVSDILPALHDLSQTLSAVQIPHCDSIDSAHACTPTSVSGISVVAQATRQLLDPKIAAKQQLRDRHGKVTSQRNDGSTNPQVTPIYLVLEALDAMDAQFAAYAAAHPGDAGRLAQWRTARSKLVDQFLTITGSGSASSFANPSVPKILPLLVTTLREQLVTHCPSSFSPPYPACPWVGDLLTNMQTSMQGPTFSSLMALGDAIRQDDSGRLELESLLTYLLDAGSENDALPALLGSTDDLIQVLRDDTNLVPFYHVAATAAQSSVVAASGGVARKGTTQATMDLLSRLTGRVYATANGGQPFEDCAEETDPNQVLTVALQNLVTPISNAGPLNGETPLQVIVDAIADVNRATPDTGTKLAATDYLSIAENVSDFLTSESSGLEQFYAVIRQGTE
jgi:hypothetical protein